MARYYEAGSSNREDKPFTEKLQQMAKDTLRRNKNYEPVLVEVNSRNICKSWWGEAWCLNLERYADWENRIERGKNYLLIGAVVDLKINGGEIISRVQGAWRNPYIVKITINPIDKRNRTRIERQATGKIQNLEALLNGTFPDDLKELFFQRNGLFPSPREIHFNCNCPDWANMCKHVAAALFAIGVKLDSNPLYFFQMRNIDVEEFVAKLIGSKVETMLKKATRTTPRVMKDADLTQLFGI